MRAAIMFLHPLLIPNQIDDDPAIGRVAPDFPLHPISALDFSLHGFDRIAGHNGSE